MCEVSIFLPFWNVDQVYLLAGFFAYLAIAGSIVPGKLVPGVVLADGTRLHYRCNGQFQYICTVPTECGSF